MTGYVFEFQDRKYDPDGLVSVKDHEAHNKIVESAELARWVQQPDAWYGYVRQNRITTWLGTEIGVIIRRSTFRNNFGGRTECITVRGTNGAIYHGRYGSFELVRLRKSKA
jgi:hypothetical protein